MKSKFQSTVTVLRNEASTEGDNGGGASTEAPAEVTNTIELPTGPLVAPTAYVTLEESQDIEATVIKARALVNHNGKPFIRLTLQMDNGRTSHDMFVTPGAAPNTFRQLKKAFGWEPTSPIEEIDGKQCSLSTRAEEFNGVTRVKVAFVNRFNPHFGESVDLASIFATAAATPEVAIEDVAF